MGHVVTAVTDNRVDGAKGVPVDLLCGGDQSTHISLYATCVASLATMMAIEAKLGEARGLCRDAVRLMQARCPERFPLAGNAFAVLAGILRERNDLREAGRLIEKGFALDRSCGNPSAVAYGFSVPARVLLAQDRLEEAAAILGMNGGT